MKKLGEGLRTIGDIESGRIYDLIKECCKDVRTLYPQFKFWNIKYKWGSGLKTFGTMCVPKYEGEPYILVLNKAMENEDDDSIKNTIYHELAHYVQYEKAFDEGVLYWDYNPRTYEERLYADDDYRKGNYWKGHGTLWKEISDNISKHFSTSITRTSPITNHSGVQDLANEKAKYIFKCSHCGSLSYNYKRGSFVNDVLNHNGHNTTWFHSCKDGTKSHEFQILKRG